MVSVTFIIPVMKERVLKKTWQRVTAQLDWRHKWIFGGELNFIEQTTDKQGGVPRHMTQVPLEWHQCRDVHLNVADPWLMNPAQRLRGSLKFSWTNARENPMELIACRLDRLYIPMDWLDRVESYSIVRGTRQSEHAPYVMNLDMSNGEAAFNQCGLDLWRVNTSLLQEDGMKKRIQEIWTQQQQETRRGGVAKLLRCLDLTRKLLRQAGKDSAKRRR